MHILIAEDDPVTGEILARTLQRWNYNTMLVVDGAQAWDRLRLATDPPYLAEWRRRNRYKLAIPSVWLVASASGD